MEVRPVFNLIISIFFGPGSQESTSSDQSGKSGESGSKLIKQSYPQQTENLTESGAYF
jgi:hypothetical protein